MDTVAFADFARMEIRVGKIAQVKLVDTNASDVESCARMVAGTARSMGIVVTED